jgi:excisionase family DNA binding protein
MSADPEAYAKPEDEHLLTPAEVAAAFRVDPKTVTRWAVSGRLASIRTPGGHRRFRESEVRALLCGDSSGPQDA